MTRRTMLRVAAATALSSYSGPRGAFARSPQTRPAHTGATKPASSGPTRAAASRLVGYGLVNKWFTLDSKDFATALVDHGCTLTEIEYMAWFDADGPRGKSIRHDLKAAARFVDSMRRRGVVTLISVVNWNGQAQRIQDDRWYHGLISGISDSIGVERVLLLPVSEPDDNGKSVRWQQYAKEHWSGALALNGPGGRGDPAIHGASYVDWHWCEDFDGSNCKPRPYLNNTDCGPVLDPGPKRVYAMAAAAAANDAHFHVYDHHGEFVDKASIAAIARALTDHPHPLPTTRR